MPNENKTSYSGDCSCSSSKYASNQDGGRQQGFLLNSLKRKDFETLVPSDKKLNPAWIQSLFDRGEPQWCNGDELKYIGMPVGGIGAGQVYLSGDGRLWHWDIFNQHIGTGADHYARPMTPEFPFEIRFEIELAGQRFKIDSSDFSDVRFRGEYPIGRVKYHDSQCPIDISLDAFSPFIPLNSEDSSLPATVMQYELTNRSDKSVRLTFRGILENAIGILHRDRHAMRTNRLIKFDDCSILECSGEKLETSIEDIRDDIDFEDWKNEDFRNWQVEGDAFGNGPILVEKMYDYLGEIGGDTPSVVNSHASAPGEIISDRDNAKGKLTSQAFTISRNYIHLWVGGGSQKDRTCVNLLIDGRIVQSITGRNSNRMTIRSFNTNALIGQQATIEIVDDAVGDWGNIGVGRIWFSDLIKHEANFDESPDTGTMSLVLLGRNDDVTHGDESAPYSEKLFGQLQRQITLAPGQSESITFLVTWHFPNLKMDKLPGGRYYATRFASAAEVGKYVVKEFERLSAHTRRWRDTWYDSTLPIWFLDRTFVNTSILASSTCYLFKDRRFYGWEGVGCCAGTCGHVWMYAQAVGRLFPDLERNLREVADFSIGIQDDGAILFRAEHNDIPAVDSQAGVVLRSLREHQISVDDGFLKRNWNSIKRAAQWLIDKDGNDDGIIETNQHNTLDSDWYGPCAWLSGLYLAALKAIELMSREMEDDSLVKRSLSILEAGKKNLVLNLFNGEYFINQPDKNHADSINSGTGCHIDQVFGQSWAHQINLGRIFPEQETKAALNSLWKYNFTPDAGAYRKLNKPGRWYAMDGEAGLLMCTYPTTDWDYDKAGGEGLGHKLFTGYFNECMNGFEYQVASHMIWEEMVTEGLAITRAIHDRYHPSRRNPYNEIECGDHYARSMASYGVYLAACGFKYHGPKGLISFEPKVMYENFSCAFTSAAGWGTFRLTPTRIVLEVKWGMVDLKTIAFPASASPLKSYQADVNLNHVKANISEHDGLVSVCFDETVTLREGDVLEVKRQKI